MVTRRKILISTIFILILSLGGFFYFRYLESERHKFKVVFLNIGQGDAALIQFENGKKMLVDCGPNRGVLSALGRNMAFYDRTIDIVLTTHPDLDHYGGCVDVLKNYQVGEVITNGRGKSDSYWQEWSKVLKNSSAVKKVIEGHEVVEIASSTLEFVSPDASLGIAGKNADSNNFSIVFRLIHNNKKFLFTGDMEAPLEKKLVEKYCVMNSADPRRDVGAQIDADKQGKISKDPCRLKSDVLKVGHHGSDGASSEFFLGFVRPKIAVISVGKNKFGHPTLRAMRHLERAGATIMRTDFLGDITMY